MQADPIKPTLKAPGTKRLKLKCDELLSIFGFNFNLRRNTLVATVADYLGDVAQCVVSQLAPKVSEARWSLSTTARPTLNLLLLLRPCI